MQDVTSVLLWREGNRVMKILFIQPDVREYREVFFKDLEQVCNCLPVCIVFDKSRNNMGILDQAILMRHYCQHYDRVIIPGFLKSFKFWFFMVYLYRFRSKIVVWTHGPRLCESNWFGELVIHCTGFFCDRILLYYPFYVPSRSNKVKYVGNSCSSQAIPFSMPGRRLRSVLILGNDTPKADLSSGLRWCLDIGFSDIKIVGTVSQSVRAEFCGPETRFFDSVVDQSEIEGIASDCWYGVYFGRIGLTLHHYLTLGLIPIIRSRKHFHMPEAFVIKEVSEYEFNGDGLLPLGIETSVFDPGYAKKMQKRLSLLQRSDLLSHSHAKRFYSEIN